MAQKIGPREQAMREMRERMARKPVRGFDLDDPISAEAAEQVSRILGPAEIVEELTAKVEAVKVPRGIGVKKAPREGGGGVSRARQPSPRAPEGVNVANAPSGFSSGKAVSIHLKVPPDVLAAYRSTGRFWQTRMIDVLRAGMPGAG